MPFAVELTLDDALADQIRELEAFLDALGAGPSLRGLGFLPHVSLATCVDLDEDAARRLLRDLAGSRAPLPVSFEAAGAFPPEGATIFLLPAANPELLALHRAFWDPFVALATEPSRYYAPTRWVPHCTVAHGVPSDARGRALAAAVSSALPMRGTLVGVGLTGTLPAVRRFWFPFARSVVVDDTGSAS